MRILVGHNFYQQAGGEDNVFAAETEMLESHGHDVVRYTRHNDEFRELSALRACAVTLWNRGSHDELRAILARERPDVCHFHNTFPLMSPSVFAAAASMGVPVVLTLHNYRLVCPAGVLMRDGRVCEECVGGPVPWRAVAHSCYRGSRAASASVAAMLALHRFLGTWRDRIDLFIALTEFAREKMIQGGLPAGKIAVKPNFILPDPGFSSERADYALFVGRLTEEKGITTLLEAWRTIGDRVPLRIIGDGPMAGEARRAAESLPGVTYLGRVPRSESLSQIRGARVLVFPSTWYEGLPLTILEAYATGLPVIASNLGSIREVVLDGRTGLLFTPGSPSELACKVLDLTRRGGQLIEMGREARREFERKYTREKNYRQLTDCYRRVLSEKDSPASVSLAVS